MSNRWSRSAFGPGAHGDDVLFLRITEGSVPVIEAHGDLDRDTVPALIAQTTSLLEDQPPPILVLDLANMQFFCAAGVRAFMQIRDLTAARGSHLILRNPSSAVCRVLTITGMVGTFDIDSCA